MGSSRSTLASARANPPRLVILDVNLPGLSGYEVCRELHDEFGEQMAIMFVSGERTQSFDRAGGLLLGADDYVVKPFALDELLARVRRLVGRSFPTARSIASKLTTREVEVLRYLALGMSQAEIAEHLGISPKTVGTHTKHIFTKLGVQSRAQAIALAYRESVAPIQQDTPAAMGPAYAGRTLRTGTGATLHEIRA